MSRDLDDRLARHREWLASRFVPWGPVSSASASPAPRAIQDPSELDVLVCGVCGGQLVFWGRSTHHERQGASAELWVFGCPDQHQAWEYDPVAGRWWLKEDSNPLAT